MTAFIQHCTENGLTIYKEGYKMNIGTNRLNNLRGGYRPTQEEEKALYELYQGEVDDFRDDPTQGYKKTRRNS